MQKLVLLSISLLVFGCSEPEDRPIETFPLTEVHLTESPFLNAQETDLNYIMAMDPDRLLAPFLEESGFKPLKPHYENWEGSGLSGHIGGHYLSALALMYASTGNDSLLTRLTYMIDWLEKCQQANGNGYVGGIPGGTKIWEEVKQGKIEAELFSLNGGWVPLYNIHKLFAGLRDAYVIGGSEKAFAVWVNLSDWMVDELKSLSDEQVQQMLKSEHGGLNEVFADLYVVTGNENYLKTADRLSHRVLLNPLLENRDELTGMHANTQIPKVIGYERTAEVGGPAEWFGASEFFWKTVVENRTVSFGGNSVREHFHPATDFSAMLSSEQGPETCNTYNMLRLSKMLFIRSGDGKYLDYYERGLYNHILSSQHPQGGFVYFTPIRPNHYRVYSKPDQDMWCCVGSGIENHGKYGELIYAHKGYDLFVNLFIPSVLDWKEEGLKISQQTKFPYEPATELVVEKASGKAFSVNIRIPEWSPLVEVTVNDKKAEGIKIGSYYKVFRKWKTGDRVTVNFTMKMAFERLPDGSAWGSFVYGPIVMGAATDTADLKGLWSDGSRMGHVASGHFSSSLESPTLITSQDPSESIVKSDDLRFTFTGGIFPDKFKNVTLEPFFGIHESRYMVYWPVTDSVGLSENLEEAAKKEAEFLKLNAVTVDYIAAGEQQPEVEHHFSGEWTWTGYSNDYYWRSTNRFISYDIRNPKGQGKSLVIRLLPEVKSAFEVLVNDKILSEVAIEPSEVPLILEFPLGESKLGEVFTLRFVAKPESTISRLLDVRVCRSSVL